MISTRDINPRNHRPGFSLIEMVLSMALLSIVMVAVGSAMVFASAATPDDDSAVALAIRDHALLNRIADDLSQARYITEQTATAITVVVPDRTGDGLPDRVRYAWGGAAGEPLKYTINNAAPVTLAPSLEAFSLGYTTSKRTELLPGAVVSKGEQSADRNGLLTGSTEHAVRTLNWYGQVIAANLSSGTTDYVPRRVSLYLARLNPQDGVIFVSIRDWTGTTVGTTEYCRTEVSETALAGAGQWYEVVFSNAKPIPANQPVALVIGYVAGTDIVGKMRSNLDLTGGFLTSTDGGATWSNSLLSSMCMDLYVEELVKDAAYELAITHHDAIQVGLASDVQQGVSSRKVRLPLSPRALTSFWDAGFDASPTALDLNQDGTKDWHDQGGAISQASFSGGQWTVDSTLKAQPAGRMNGVVIVQTRLMSTTSEGLRIDGPYSAEGGSLLPFSMQLTQSNSGSGSGSQTLTLYNDESSTTPIAAINNLPLGWVDLRLVMLTAEDQVTIQVNGETVGTLALSRVSNSTIERSLSLVPLGTGGKIDYLRIAVGGSYAVVTDGLLTGLISDTFSLLGL